MLEVWWICHKWWYWLQHGWRHAATWLLRQEEGPASDGLGVGRDDVGPDLEGVHPPPNKSSMSTWHTHAHYIQLIQPSPMAMFRHSLWRQEIDVWRANGLNYLARSTNFIRKWIKTGSWSGYICRSLDDEKSLKHPNLQNCYFFSILTSAFQSCCCCWGAAGCGCCCCELLPQGSSQSSETLLRAGPELKVFPLGTVHP